MQLITSKETLFATSQKSLMELFLPQDLIGMPNMLLFHPFLSVSQSLHCLTLSDGARGAHLTLPLAVFFNSSDLPRGLKWMDAAELMRITMIN